MTYVAVRTSGIPTIFDGRLFLLNTGNCSFADGDLVPPGIEALDLEFDGKPCKVFVADPGMPVGCPTCERLFVHEVIRHTGYWMTMGFYCEKHREQVWVDIFPKADGWDTTWDKTNALPRFIDRAKMVAVDDERLAIGEIILNPETGMDRYRAYMKHAPLRYTLTPKGLREIGLAGMSKRALRSTGSLMSRCVSFFR